MISEEILWEYADGTLDEKQCEAIAQAIAGDAALAAKYKDIAALHQQLQMLAPESAPAGFTAHVISAVGSLPVYGPLQKISVFPVLAFGLPLLLIMLAACIFLSNSGILHPFTFQPGPAVWNYLGFYSMLADVVLLLLFAETWYYRFKNTMV